MLPLRLSAAILLLILTFSLARLSPQPSRQIDTVATLGENNASCLSSMDGRISYFSTYPEKSLFTYDNPGVERTESQFPESADYKYTGLFTSDRALGSMEVMEKGRLADQYLSGRKDFHVRKSVLCSGPCEVSVFEADYQQCQKSIVDKLLSAEKDIGCFVNVKISEKREESLSTTISINASSLVWPTVEFDDDVLTFVSGSALQWTIHKIKIDKGEKNSPMFNHTYAPVHNVNAIQLQPIDARGLIVRNRLGQRYQVEPAVHEKFANLLGAPAVNLIEAAAAVPYQLLRYKKRLVLIRLDANSGFFASIFSQDLQLERTIQFANMDSGWIIHAPDTAEESTMFLMGASPPYAWQTQAVNLITGEVESRHSFF